MQKFSDIVNRQIVEQLEPVNEVNILNWLMNFLKKTSDFISVWLKKGNKKYKIDLTKGSLQSNKKESKMNIMQLNKEWKSNEIYKKCYPKTTRFITSDYKMLKPDSIGKNDWENIILKLYVYTPKVNYNGENYPCSVAIYPQKKLELIKNYLNIDSFETSELITNEEAMKNILFETFIDDLRASKGTSYVGITLIPKDPSIYKKFKYHGKGFIEDEIEDKEEDINEANDEDNDNDNDDNDKDDKNKAPAKKIRILKLDF